MRLGGVLCKLQQKGDLLSMATKSYQITVFRYSDKDLHEIEVVDTIEQVNKFIKDKLDLSSEIYKILVHEYKTDSKLLADLSLLIPKNK